MNYISKVLIIAGFGFYIFLFNCPALLASTGYEEVKGGVLEGQAFVEGVKENIDNLKGHTVDSGNKELKEGSNQEAKPTTTERPGKLVVRSISPDEAADEINSFFGGVYKLISKISPQGFVVAILLLTFAGPFISNFFVRLVLSAICYFVIQKAPFIVGTFQGLLPK